MEPEKHTAAAAAANILPEKMHINVHIHSRDLSVSLGENAVSKDMLCEAAYDLAEAFVEMHDKFGLAKPEKDADLLQTKVETQKEEAELTESKITKKKTKKKTAAKKAVKKEEPKPDTPEKEAPEVVDDEDTRDETETEYISNTTAESNAVADDSASVEYYKQGDPTMKAMCFETIKKITGEDKWASSMLRIGQAKKCAQRLVEEKIPFLRNGTMTPEATDVFTNGFKE